MFLKSTGLSIKVDNWDMKLHFIFLNQSKQSGVVIKAMFSCCLVTIKLSFLTSLSHSIQRGFLQSRFPTQYYNARQAPLRSPRNSAVAMALVPRRSSAAAAANLKRQSCKNAVQQLGHSAALAVMLLLQSVKTHVNSSFLTGYKKRCPTILNHFLMGSTRVDYFL